MQKALPVTHSIHAGPVPFPANPMICSLDYDGRFLRRKRLTTDCGTDFLVDFEKTISLDHGMQLSLSDGRFVTIKAKAEELAAITGANLVRLAWHIGNRHTPCQIEAARLLIQRDHVIEHMIAQLGGQSQHVVEPFRPEGGAYGFGRSLSHDHVHSAHHG